MAASSILTGDSNIVGAALPLYATTYLLPQIIRTIKIGKAEDLALGTLALDVSTSTLFTSYGIEIDAKPFIVSSSLAVLGGLSLSYLKMRDIIKTGKEKITSLIGSALTIAGTCWVIDHFVNNNEPNMIMMFGGIAASLVYVPQSYKSIRTKKTEDLSLTSLVMDFSGCSLLLLYGAMIGDNPLMYASGALVSFISIPTGLKLKDMIRKIRYPEKSTSRDE